MSGKSVSYGGPQLSQQQQITHSNNKLIATITKTSHQNQIAHSTNQMLTAQTKTLTAQTKTLTAQTKTLTAPPMRGGLSCFFLDLKKEGITWPWQVKIFAEVLDVLTRVCLENVCDSGRVKIEWILDAFNKVFILDFNPSFYLHHDNWIRCWEIQQSHTTYVSHVLQQITIGVGDEIIYLRLKKRTVIKIITKTKLLGQ